MEDGCIIGHPSFFQNKVDMMHADDPSSTMYRCTTMFQMDYKVPDPLTDEEDATNTKQMGKQPHEHEHG